MTHGHLAGRQQQANPEPQGVRHPHIDFGDPQLAQQIDTGVAQVEALLEEHVRGQEPFITEKTSHLLAAGGKRFRPMFAMLASQYGPNPGCDKVLQAACVVEMTHLATLYHDDVMDEADKRRGVISANARWDNSIAILAGDYLLARASHVMAGLGTETVAHFAETFGQLVTGQMRETVGPGEGDKIEHYMHVIHEKTGVLIGSAGYLGALHAGADQATTAALQKLGFAIGTIFQIVDDIIDIFSDTSQSGKIPGTDLREGIFTLPVLYALREDTPVGEQLRQILTGPVTDEQQVATVLELLHQSTGREQALQVVEHNMQIAQEQLAKLPAIPATQALRSVMEYTVARVG
ncbi:polyprenyl synthetase family protein [Corynebacterium choanae]|uniref:Heptaprenyl diphosphate synthase component 2 n=1 Tax=Corynebacterium choanae TaxID=1862358 RepID=A0A3G6J8L4_9CORY|nr:polyprenyl synthetase family protein [Corynebacterium choanae]AZA14451.1 Heptaprenyl diphosphate synthase component 2 [Corynebacterium choanae]